MDARNNSGCEQASARNKCCLWQVCCLQQVLELLTVCRTPSTSGALAEDELVFRPLAAVSAAPEVRGGVKGSRQCTERRAPPD